MEEEIQEPGWQERFAAWRARLGRISERRSVRWTGVALVAVAVIAFLYWFPRWEIAGTDISQPARRAEAINEARRTYAQIVGGLFLLAGLYYTARRVWLTEQGQITDRFTAAVEHLGHEAVEVRMGGIYALERLAKDSLQDHWTVMEVLSAYVRTNAPWTEPEFGDPGWPNGWHGPDDQAGPACRLAAPSCPSDIQAAVAVLCRRDSIHDKGLIDLTGTDLRGLDFQLGKLERAIFSRAHLERARFHSARLRRATFDGAHLEGAGLDRAHVQGVTFQSAHLQRTSFSRADLREAHFLSASSLQGANFHAARLSDDVDFSGKQLGAARFTAAHLPGARFMRAELNGASFTFARLPMANFDYAALRGTHFVNAQLRRACFTGADLERANLGQAQLQGADFSGTHLREAELRAADLTRASFICAKLSGADFTAAQLTGVEFAAATAEDADFRCANLAGAIFANADLSGASFRDANLEGADLRGAKHVDLTGAIVDDTTKLPDDAINLDKAIHADEATDDGVEP